jgi:myo-inositol 2-dehydrogenase/D-chiro-inositol 1-dehydrogenase
MNLPVRFAVIGYGAWGAHHARAIVESPAATLAAIVARSPSSQDAARQAHPQVPVVTDYHEALARDDVDMIDVVLPSDLHYEVGCAALRAGKHLLIEKPMALTVEDCDAMMACAQKHGCKLAVGHELRLSSLWARVRQMIDENAIGEPRYVLIELWRRPYRPGADGWRYDARRVGNWILEEPIHFFDLARWYLAGAGEPQSIFARANAATETRPELQDNFSAIVNFPHDAYAVISQTLSAFEHHQVVKVTGSRGSLWAGWSGATDRTFHPTFSLKHHDGETVREVIIPKPSGEVFELVDEITACAMAVAHGTPLPVSGEDGRWSVAMCLAAQKSVDAGTPIAFPSAHA